MKKFLRKLYNRTSTSSSYGSNRPWYYNPWVVVPLAIFVGIPLVFVILVKIFPKLGVSLRSMYNKITSAPSATISQFNL